MGDATVGIRSTIFPFSFVAMRQASKVSSEAPARPHFDIPHMAAVPWPLSKKTSLNREVILFSSAAGFLDI
jgi:hypothetical protein